MADSHRSSEYQHFEHEPETVELPITPAMTVLFTRKAASDSKNLPTIAGISLIVVLIIGLVLYLRLDREAFLVFWLIIVGAWLFFALYSAWSWRNDARNRGARTFLRTHGLARRFDTEGGYAIRVGKRAFTTVTLPVYEACEDLDYAVVDYMKAGHEIIEIRDSVERVRYRIAGYQPEEGTEKS